MKNNSNILGYRLHKNRIVFSGGQIIRTIKYPLKNFDNSLYFLNKFKEAVKDDDLRIRGNINLNDYGKSKTYTLTDFWIDCLRAGVVWQPSAKYLRYLIQKVYSEPEALKIIKKARPDILKFFDIEKFVKSFILPQEIRSSKKEKNFKKEIVEALKDEFLDKNKNDDKGDYLERINNNQAKNLVIEITNCFFSNGELITNSIKDNKKIEYQNRLWEEKFGIEKRKLFESFKIPAELSKFKDISFFIIPELFEEGKKINDLSDSIKKLNYLIEIRKRWLEDNNILTDKEQLNEELRNLVGLSENCNPLSNFLGTIFCELVNANKKNQRKKLESFYEIFKIIEPKIEHLGYRGKILESLEIIASCAKRLGFPKVVNLLNQDLKMSFSEIKGWSEYRQNFGSKMQSWFTSYIKRDELFKNSLKKFLSSIKKAQKYIKKIELDLEAKEEKKELEKLFKRIIEIIERFNEDIQKREINKEENFETFNTLLSSLRKRLNIFYQKYFWDEKKENDNIRKHQILGEIYEKIKKPIAFYAETQLKTNKKFIEETIPILEEGINFTKNLIKELQKTFSPDSVFKSSQEGKETKEILYRKQLQFIWNKLKDLAINSEEFRKKYKQIINSISEEKVEDLLLKGNKNKFTFYKDNYSKGDLREIKLKKTGQDYLSRYKDLVIHLSLFLLEFDKKTLLKNKRLLLDWVELSRNVISILIKFNNKKEFSILDFKKLEKFKKLRNYLNFFRLKNIKNDEFNFIIQSFILSEIKGAANLFSKEKYIASYSIHLVNSDNKFKIYYQPLSKEIDLIKETKKPKTETKELMKKHRYLIAHSKLKIYLDKNQKENLVELLNLGKKEIFYCKTLEDELYKKVFIINSSPYQLQFLDKYLYRPKGWENIDIILNEWSFIVEEAYKITWDLRNKKPIFTLDKESNRNKLYVAIPFTLKPRIKDKPLLDKIVLKPKSKYLSTDINRLKYPILGVDVGEYGLAWCLVKFDYDEKFKLIDINILGKGFIYDRNIAKIKDYFSKIQQKSRLGLYNEEDNTIFQIRKNAIGKLRNTLHSIILSLSKEGGASLVYEDIISNFETGSGRTIKIYKSVKRADTKFETEADRNEHNNVWGKNTRYIGKNLSAYASSYFCINCLRSIYQIKNLDLKNKFKVKKRNGNILIITTPYGTVRGYTRDKSKYLEGKSFLLSKKNSEELIKILKDFTRPPLERSEVIRKYVLNRGILNEKKLIEFKKKRGNSAIFVCPFCKFVADADIQAAFIMAVRGYLRFSGIVENLKLIEENNKKQNNFSKKVKPKIADKFIIKTIECLENISPEIKEKIKQTIKIV